MSYFTRLSIRISGTIAMLLTLWVTSLFSQTKPQVGVQLRIEDSNYRSYYASEPGLSIEMIESAGSDAVVALLNHHFPFIEFTRNSVAEQITFTLSEGIVAGIKVVPTLVISPTESYQADPFTFRDANQAIDDPPASREAFAQELQNKFSEWINTKKENLITEIFGHVKVCKSALAIPASKKWVMPFKMEDLQIGARSSLQVVTSIEGDLGEELCDYNTTAQGPVTTASIGAAHIGKMFCNIEDANSNCPPNLQFLRIEGVYLKKFIKLGSIESSPASFNFSDQ